MISNWDERLRPLLEALKLARYFEVIVVSCEVGVAKPALEIFQEAAGRLGVPTEAILHVGDSFESDVQGARAAGFHALKVAREDSSRGAGRIRSLREVLALVGQTA